MNKKNIFLAMMAILFSTGLMAQGRSTTPPWTISKDVQKIQFRNQLYEPTTIITGNTYPAGKGISRIHQGKTTERSAIVKMTGTPSHVISKGIARLQYERDMK